MVTARALLLAVVAIAVGLYQGRIKTSGTAAGSTALGLMGTSNLLACWPYFVAGEPTSWVRTYLTGLLATGLASLLIHVAPFLITWYLAKRFWKRSTHAA